jgi:pilus assembly protein Flp/PilA
MDLVCTIRQHVARLGRSMRALVDDESGATAMEYALIATLISVAIIGAATTMGSNLNNVWTTLANNVNPNLSR